MVECPAEDALSAAVITARLGQSGVSTQRIAVYRSQIHKRSFRSVHIKSPAPVHPTQAASRHARLEPLLLRLRLRSRNCLVGIRVLEPAPLLPVLELGADSRAHARALPVVGAAALLAVGVRDAAAGGELLAVAVADGRGAGFVGLDLGEGGGGDWAC